MNRSRLLAIAAAAALAFSTLAAPAMAAERMPPMAADQMTPEQKRVADEIMATRRTLGGPFSVWLRSPVMADRFQAVGEYLRFNAALPKAMRELAIMVTAREWNTAFEWNAHYREATGAGIKPELLAAVAEGRRPEGMSEDEAMIYDFSRAMHEKRGQVSDQVFDAVRKRFGDQGVVDLIGLNAYYVVAAMTINATEVPTPPNRNGAPPLKPLP